MPEDLTTVQIDFETRDNLRKLAGEDFRSMAAELRWLVSEEFARRYSTPQPVITIDEAQRNGGSNG